MVGFMNGSNLGRLVSIAAASALLLGACETSRDIVDAVNPVSWFDSDAEVTEDTEPKPIPGQDGDYPAIGTVPQAPGEPAIKREYLALADVLAADRENALYSDEVIRKESPPLRVTTPPNPAAPPAEPPTASSITPPPEAPSTVEAPQPAPAPQPVPAPQPSVAAAPQPAPVPQPVPRAVPVPQPSTATQSAAAPAVAPSPAPTPAPVPTPAPTPQPLVPSASSAPTPSAAPPPSAAPSVAPPSGQSAAAAAQVAIPTRSQMIATIYFPSGGAALTERDRGILQQVAQIYNRDAGKRVVIVGHSSRSGAAGSESEQALVNYKVSLDRAAAVGQALVASGVPLQEIVVDARGAQELKYSEETQAGEAGNRRAEIFLQY